MHKYKCTAGCMYGIIVDIIIVYGVFKRPKKEYFLLGYIQEHTTLSNLPLAQLLTKIMVYALW